MDNVRARRLVRFPEMFRKKTLQCSSAVRSDPDPVFLRSERGTRVALEDTEGYIGFLKALPKAEAGETTAYNEDFS